MMLVLHIIVSMLSLALHSALLFKHFRGAQASRITTAMYSSIVAAVLSGILILDGSAKGYAHGIGMLGVLGAFHVALAVARRTYAPKRSK